MYKRGQLRGIQAVGQGLQRHPQSSGMSYFISFLIGGILILLGLFGFLEVAATNFPYSWSLIIGIIFLIFFGYRYYILRNWKLRNPGYIIPFSTKFKLWFPLIIAIFFILNGPQWLVSGFASFLYDVIAGPIIQNLMIYYFILIICGIALIFAGKGFWKKLLGIFLTLFSLYNIPFLNNTFSNIPKVGEYIDLLLGKFGPGTLPHSFVITMVGLIIFMSHTKAGNQNITM